MTPQIAARQFLDSRIDFERFRSMPNAATALKLDRMRELLDRLNNPQNAFPIIHVAGTKGKGSTAAMIAAVLQAGGYRTGLFTSPHVNSVEERMAIDAQPCPADEFAELIAQIRPAVEAMDQRIDPKTEIGPTFFEILTAAALLHFSRNNVDAAVLEVGMGGRLDSTNVCSPCLSIITSISLDHTRQLGDTLELIAAEKAGIVKPGVPVVSGVREAEPQAVIRRIASDAGCRLIQSGVDFDFEYHPPRHLERAPAHAQFDYVKPRPVVAPECATTGRGFTDGDATIGRGFILPMSGRHQSANAAVALAAIDELRRDGWTISEEAIRHGLIEVACPARTEVISRHPAVVIDAAHNTASIESLVAVLAESFSVDRRILIFAATQEKDIAGMLRVLLANFDHIIFTRYTNNPRAVPPEELQALASNIKPRPSVATPTAKPRPVVAQSDGAAVELPPQHSDATTGRGFTEIAPTPADAWRIASGLAQPNDLICVTGSFFLAAELRAQLV